MFISCNSLTFGSIVGRTKITPLFASALDSALIMTASNILALGAVG
jgi:hypothetical protein